jgi:hypothetical protein
MTTGRWSRLWPSMAKLGRRQALTLAGASMALPLAEAAAADPPPNPWTPPEAARVPRATPPQPASPAPRRWPAYFGRKLVWGYVNRHSVLQGEGFDLMLSVGSGQPPARGRVEFQRLGHNADPTPRPAWISPQVSVSAFRTNAAAAALGPNWPPAFAAIDTAGWPPGYYSADFVGEAYGQRDPHIAQIIVRPPRPRGHVLLKLGTSTYQAYNDWGGYSFYTGGRDDTARGAMLSFDRPSLPGFLEYEIFLANWLEELAEREGFQVDYASNFDVHSEPTLLPAYRLVICGSHDEYWSKEEFDAFERRIFRLGGHTIFFGGNTAYWQVRYADIDRPPGGVDRGRQIICYKSLHDPIARRSGTVDPDLLVTAQFREGSRRPESMLMGVAYQSWFSPSGNPPQHAPYTVVSTDAPFFEGTDYKPGDFAADVVGYEWDNRDPYNNGARLWDKGRSHIPELPADRLQVLFRGTPLDVWGRRSLAEAVFFTSPSGAKVFSSGTIRWAWGLGKPGFTQPAFQKFNENLIRHFLA